MLADQQGDDLGAEMFFQWLERGIAHRAEGWPGFLRLWSRFAHEQAIRHQCVDVWVEVEMLAKGVEGKDEAGDASGAVEGGAQILADALGGELAELPQQVPPEAKADLEDLAQYILRNPFSVEKMTLESPGDIVIYRSRLNAKINRKFEVFSATDFLAAITQHFPDKGAQMVRY